MLFTVSKMYGAMVLTMTSELFLGALYDYHAVTIPSIEIYIVPLQDPHLC